MLRLSRSGFTSTRDVKLPAEHPTTPASHPARLSFDALWLTLAIIFCLLVLARLVQQSMTIDGTLYAAIARNLAAGDGALWHLRFSGTLFPYFAEHPPLMLWLEAIGFWLFGDSLAVERGFSLVTALLNAAVLLGIWRQLTRDTPYQALGVVALILTLVAGRIGFALASALIENLQMIFTSLATLLVLVAYRDGEVGSRTVRSFWMVCAGLAIALAVLAKGPVGLFPLVVPVFYAIAFRTPRLWGAVFDTALVLLTVAAVSSVLLLFDAPREYFLRYVDGQLVSSLSGARGGAGVWKAVKVFVPVALFPLLIALLFVAMSKWLGPVRPAARMSRGSLTQTALFLLAIGIAGSGPIFLSPRVAAYYFNPSLPFYAMALACVCAPFVLNVFQRTSALWLRRVRIALVAGVAISLGIVAYNVGKPGPDRDLIADARQVAAHICPSAERCARSIASCQSVWEEWQFHAYMARNQQVDLALDAPTAAGALYLTNSGCATPVARRATEINIGLSAHRLYALEALD
jgi:4-amino-4-deoxy-L-arabinose transferase-like glycosyltransferase